MNRISQFIFLLKSAKWKFSKPNKSNLLIFDDTSIESLKYLIEDYDYSILQTRLSKDLTLYFNPSIIFKTLLNFRGNIWTSYLITLIKFINPKIVITFIDNSFKFFEIAKRMQSKKINFFAIQNGARYDLNRYKHLYKKKILKEDFTKKFFIPNFFCFGDYEIEEYKEKNIDIKKFIPVGSLRLANFILKNKINLKDNRKTIYDILCISDGFQNNFDQRFGTEGEIERVINYIKFVIKYSLKNNKKIIFSLKRLNSSVENLHDELMFYKKNLSDYEYDYFIKNSTINFKRSLYLTYELMLCSDVTISAYSTILRENLSIGRKSIFVYFMQNTFFDTKIDDICKIGYSNFDTFEKKLNKICLMKHNEFIKKISDYNSIMHFNKGFNTIELIKKELNKYLI